jgi:hypothetical protein
MEQDVLFHAMKPTPLDFQRWGRKGGRKSAWIRRLKRIIEIRLLGQAKMAELLANGPIHPVKSLVDNLNCSRRVHHQLAWYYANCQCVDRVVEIILGQVLKMKRAAASPKPFSNPQPSARHRSSSGGYSGGQTRPNKAEARRLRSLRETSSQPNQPGRGK